MARLDTRQTLPIRLVFAISACLLLLPAFVFGQVVGATLSGTVTDPSGALIPGVQISIKNTATGVTRELMTDETGFYTAPNLLPGVYEVTASAAGFSKTVQSNITLSVSAQQRLNLSLRVGETNQVVEVNEAAPQVQLQSSTISAEVGATVVRELPLNGRDWAALATLQPGVNAIETQLSFETGAARGNRGFGSQLTISGGRPTQNNYRLDGVSINDHGNGAPGSVIGVNLGVDAIQEFSVLTGNYSAEYGKTSGGVVNAITKSGTNAFHGDVYEFLRNDALDANSFFGNASNQNKPSFRRNQFGGAAGGPIRKDRTFIFGDYEAIRQSKGITLSQNVPSLAARAGNLCSIPSGNPPCTPTTVTVDPAAKAFLALYPVPNGPLSSSGDRGAYTFSGQQVVNENFFTTRSDHKISEKDSLYGTYMYDNTGYVQPDSMNNYTVQSHTRRNMIALEDSHVFTSTFINTFRIGYNRAATINFQGLSAINPAAEDKSLASVPGQNPARVFIGGGFSSNNGGVSTLSFYRHYWNNYQVFDDAFVTRGTHSIKFGGAVEVMRYNFITFQNPGGTWRFGSLTNFLTNRANSFESGLPTTITPRGMRQTLFAGYVQDNWRWRRNLTVNLGVRYEAVTVLKERQGKLTNLVNITDPLPRCGVLVAGCGSVGPYYSNPTLRNFEPRVGFAWAPFRDAKTAVRGGFALFDVLPLPGYFLVQNNQATPFATLGTVNNTTTPLAGKFFTGGFPLLGVNTLSASSVEANPHRNYVMQWNLNLQHQLASNLTATAGYIGSRGVHMLIRGDDADMVLPTKTDLGYLWPFPAGSGTRINPNYGSIRNLSWGTDSWYDALEVGIQKRMSHGIQLQGSYTWAKAIDNDSATIAGDTFSNSITTWFNFDPKISRSVSDFNIAHSLVINGTWQVPSGSLHGPAAAVLGGWELGGIFKANSGIPTTPVIGGDPMGVLNAGSDAFGIPNRIAGCDPINHDFKNNPTTFMGYVNVSCFDLPRVPASMLSLCSPFPNDPKGLGNSCKNLLGNAGRNSITGPHLFNFDASLFKNNYVRRISETFNVQFRAEFFNVLNHPNFAPPLPFITGALFNENGSLAGGGNIDRLVTEPRDIQFALKIIW